MPAALLCRDVGRRCHTLAGTHGPTPTAPAPGALALGALANAAVECRPCYSSVRRQGKRVWGWVLQGTGKNDRFGSAAERRTEDQ